MGSQFVEAVNQMSGCMGYTVLFRARSKCVCCIYHLCISHYKLSTCTNTPHWGLTKKSRYKEGVPCQSGNPQPLQVTIHHLQETLYALHSLHNPTFVMFCAGKTFISLSSEGFMECS